MATPIKEEDKVHVQWYEEARKQTLDTLPDFLKKLTTNYQHDYGTICHAIAAAAVGAAWAVEHSPQGGITGFQGGAVMWEFMKHWNGIEFPAWLRKGQDMLYPQYEEEFTTISKETWAWLQAEARKKLSADPKQPGRVADHWRAIVDGKVPFGYGVSER